MVQAEAPSRPIERGVAGPGLLAHVLVSKYCDHGPLYRQTGIYARQDLELERSTLADWVGGQPVAGTAGGSAGPLRDGREFSVMPDDTPVPVLAAGNGKTKTGRLWTYVRDDRPAGDTAAPAVWFAYSPDREGENPERHLEKFRGTLQADACAGFNQLYEMVASSKPRAGRTCGASSTIWNKRTFRRWRGKRCSGSGHCMESKNRFAAIRRSSARSPPGGGGPAAARFSAAVVRSDPVEALAEVGDDGGDSLRRLALGGADALYRRWTHRDRQQRRRTLFAWRGLGRKNYLFAGSDAAGSGQQPSTA